jgi:pantoate--beta-alanine ligase
MKIVRTVKGLRAEVTAARARGEQVGLVPTMGALHEGHLSLIRRARERTALVIVSLFVNPTQFNEAADLSRYPRDEARDAGLAASAGADILFAPSVDEIYPPLFATTIGVGGVSEPLEGVVRGPTHFRGVATIVAKLLNMAQPHVAVFGQKDAQQALLIRRMVRDLDIPVEIEVCPTVREADGLAMSSRNVLLDPEARRRAPALYRALQAVAAAVANGERRAEKALAAGQALLTHEGIEAEYFTAVSTSTLAPVTTIEGETLVPIAARFGEVRLIDNVIIMPPVLAS